jgi:hypothetical protein
VVILFIHFDNYKWHAKWVIITSCHVLNQSVPDVISSGYLCGIAVFPRFKRLGNFSVAIFGMIGCLGIGNPG